MQPSPLLPRLSPLEGLRQSLMSISLFDWVEREHALQQPTMTGPGEQLARTSRPLPPPRPLAQLWRATQRGCHRPLTHPRTPFAADDGPAGLAPRPYCCAPSQHAPWQITQAALPRTSIFRSAMKDGFSFTDKPMRIADCASPWARTMALCGQPGQRVDVRAMRYPVRIMGVPHDGGSIMHPSCMRRPQLRAQTRFSTPCCCAAPLKACGLK